MKTEVIGMYSKDNDTTFVVRRTTNAAGEITTQTVTGFYHGSPTDANNETFDGVPTAKYENEEATTMKYQILSHEYNNTGGGCMVSTFKVYLIAENRTAYVHVNEEGGTLATCDYINEDIEFSDTMAIDEFSIQFLTEDSKYFELYKYCIIEYFKRDCRRYLNKVQLPYHLLPKELQQYITPDYIVWHEENVGGGYETDGYDLFLSEDYKEPNAEINQAKEMLQYMDDALHKFNNHDADVNNWFYSLQASVTFGDKTLSVDNCSAIFEAIQNCLKQFIENY